MKALLNYILNTFIVFVILLAGHWVFNATQTAYYKLMPISTFYEHESFTADDACIGAKSHLVHAKRFVYGTDIGYGGEIIREMFLFKDGKEIKVLGEHSMPFVEVRNDGLVTRLQPLPTDLEEGEYQWVMYLTLVVHGVLRDDIAPIESNVFKIIPCV